MRHRTVAYNSLDPSQLQSAPPRPSHAPSCPASSQLWNRARPEAPAVTVPYTGNDAGLAAAYMATFFPAMAGPATQGMAAAETLLSALRAGAEAGEAAAPYLGERMSGMIGAADALAGDPQLGVLSTTQSKQRAPATFVDSAWAGWEPLGAVAPDCSEIFSWVVDAAQESDLPGLISASEEDVKDGDENGLEMDRPFGEIGMGKLLTCVDARSRALTSIDDMKELLLCGHYEAAEECRMGANPQTNEFPFAIDWRDSGPGRLRLSLWYNATTSEVDTEDDQGAPRNLHRLVKPLNLAVQAWVREHVGADYEVRLSHTREMPNAARTLTLDIASLLGPAFYIFVLGLPLPTIVQALMYEKENRLRVMMKMHGLTDLSYWVVSYMWWGLTSTLYSIILLVVGVAAGLEFFKRNDPLVSRTVGGADATTRVRIVRSLPGSDAVLSVAFSLLFALFSSHDHEPAHACAQVQIVFYITAMHAQIGQVSGGRPGELSTPLVSLCDPVERDGLFRAGLPDDSALQVDAHGNDHVQPVDPSWRPVLPGMHAKSTVHVNREN